MFEVNSHAESFMSFGRYYIIQDYRRAASTWTKAVYADVTVTLDEFVLEGNFVMLEGASLL
eukprot:m.49679 g.49679  ORF g.49679 m.49679 type:complete len:61 (+) comp10623_c0_seq3:108-290(+)